MKQPAAEASPSLAISRYIRCAKFGCESRGNKSGLNLAIFSQKATNPGEQIASRRRTWQQQAVSTGKTVALSPGTKRRRGARLQGAAQGPGRHLPRRRGARGVE